MNSKFYETLYSLMSKNNENDNGDGNGNGNDNGDENDNENLCMITYETLENDHVILECGHKFNYIPIFKEVYNQKFNSSKLEVQTLFGCQIKCPYCRNIQNSLLPPNEKVEQTNLVNSPEKHCMKTKFCKYIFRGGCRKGNVCNIRCVTEYCSKHKGLAARQEKKLKLLSDKDKVIYKLKDDIVSYNKKWKELYKYIRRNTNVCTYEKCKCKCKSIGLQQFCFKHMDEKSKDEIKQKKQERLHIANKIIQLKEQINLHNILENVE